MITGHDVSSYQPKAVPLGDFCFVKATEGTGYVNPKLAAQTASARADGQIVGFYHFLHPGNPIGQARFFVANTHLLPGDLLVCDWENTRFGHATSAEKDAFLHEVERLRSQHLNGLYCNTYDWKNRDVSGHCGDFLWIADYNGTPGRVNITHPWVIHQWKSSPVDTNVAEFTSRAAMRSWSRKKIPVAPKPPAPKKVVPRPNFIAIRDHARAAMLANPPSSSAYKAAAAVLKIIAPFVK